MEKFILGLNLTISKDMMIRGHFLKDYDEALDQALKIWDVCEKDDSRFSLYLDKSYIVLTNSDLTCSVLAWEFGEGQEGFSIER